MLQIYSDLLGICAPGISQAWLCKGIYFINQKNMQMQSFWKGRV